MALKSIEGALAARGGLSRVLNPLASLILGIGALRRVVLY